ncbi:hypothetical protein OIU85_011900 [Salix viminalis]|uniref:Uncharacterized protein n=1 Tax=Salix viminalis TaxID=40686 RepID=A0A9Q0NTX4_SALVM|nr:hypothetical protein OIU85_011900 [Salix viminalis]
MKNQEIEETGDTRTGNQKDFYQTCGGRNLYTQTDALEHVSLAHRALHPGLEQKLGYEDTHNHHEDSKEHEQTKLQRTQHYRENLVKITFSDTLIIRAAERISSGKSSVGIIQSKGA